MASYLFIAEYSLIFSSTPTLICASTSSSRPSFAGIVVPVSVSISTPFNCPRLRMLSMSSSMMGLPVVSLLADLALPYGPMLINLMNFSPLYRLLNLQPHQAGNQVALHLRGAGADRDAARVAEISLHVELHVVAVTAHDVHCRSGDLDEGLGAEQLGHGNFAQSILPVGDHPGCAPGQQACGIDRGLHVGEHVGDRLIGADGAPELLAVLGILQSGVDHRLRTTVVTRGGRKALVLQAGEHAFPAVVLAADQPLVRHPDVVEKNLIGPDAAAAEHLELAKFYPMGVVVDQEQRKALAVVRPGIGLHVHADDVAFDPGRRGP